MPTPQTLTMGRTLLDALKPHGTAALAAAHATQGKFQLTKIISRRSESSNALARVVAGLKAPRAHMTPGP